MSDLIIEDNKLKKALSHKEQNKKLKDKKLKELLNYFPQKEEKDILKKAFKIADNAHIDQYRKSGEPFIIHPLEVAIIIASQNLSSETVAASILHDVIEDTNYDYNSMKEDFGVIIANLVDGVTKIERIAKRGSKEREQLATYRKLLLAACNDARVLVIKLADRLHNLRTISSLKKNRQEAIATETLEIYAPLAHRLGMNQLKEEIEDLSYAILNPKDWEEADLLQKENLASVSILEKLEDQLKQELEKNKIDSIIKTRVKNRYSISQKIKRKKSPKEIYDIMAMRIIVNDVKDCYIALGVIHQLWAPRFDRFHDYIALPKANLYQSLHTTVMTKDGRLIEIQIRTYQQDEIAEHGIAAHWAYKETLKDGGPSSTKDFIHQVVENQDYSSLEAAFEALKQDVFNQEIYVFTPQGDVKILPYGACSIDFAYLVHSDIGHSCVGSKVNNELVSITNKLKNADVVEILTSKTANPSRDWLNYVVTSKAKTRIKHFYEHQEDDNKIEQGLKIIKENLNKAGLGPYCKEDKLYNLLEELNYSPEQAALYIYNNKNKEKYLLDKIINYLATPEQDPQESFVGNIMTKANRKLKPDNIVGIEVTGHKGIMTRIANCCNPIPGDDIVGYVSLQRGVTIHHKKCPNLKSLSEDRFIKVNWEEKNKNIFKTEINLILRDRQSIIKDIINQVEEVGAELNEINIKSDGTIARGKLTCNLIGKEHSDNLKNSLQTIDGILKVERKY